MATTIPCKIHIPLRLPRPLNPTKPPASKTARPANCELVLARADPSTYPPLLSLKSAAATRPNLHSLNSWPAVQCNEGFCNASEGQRLPLTTTMASQKPHHSAKRSKCHRAFHRSVELECPSIGLDAARFSCCCCGLFSGPAELGAVNPYAVHDHSQPACQRHDRLFHPAAPGDLPRL